MWDSCDAPMSLSNIMNKHEFKTISVELMRQSGAYVISVDIGIVRIKPGMVLVF